MWEDSPTGWPQPFEGKQNFRTDGRPASQRPRLKAGHSDDLGTGRALTAPTLTCVAHGPLRLHLKPEETICRVSTFLFHISSHKPTR